MRIRYSSRRISPGCVGIRFLGSMGGLTLECELNTDGSANTLHICVREDGQSFRKPLLADRGELIRHRFSLLAVEVDIRLAGVEAVGVACDRHHLDAVEVAVGCQCGVLSSSIIPRSASHSLSPDPRCEYTTVPLRSRTKIAGIP